MSIPIIQVLQIRWLDGASPQRFIFFGLNMDGPTLEANNYDAVPTNGRLLLWYLSIFDAILYTSKELLNKTLIEASIVPSHWFEHISHFGVYGALKIDIPKQTWDIHVVGNCNNLLAFVLLSMSLGVLNIVEVSLLSSKTTILHVTWSVSAYWNILHVNIPLHRHTYPEIFHSVPDKPVLTLIALLQWPDVFV